MARRPQLHGAVPARRHVFYGLWLVAALAYGLGDLLTTVTILTSATHVAETNLLITVVFDALGNAGLLALKLTVLLCGLWVSVTAITHWEAHHLSYGPPVILATLGTLVTAHNVHLVLLP